MRFNHNSSLPLMDSKKMYRLNQQIRCHSHPEDVTKTVKGKGTVELIPVDYDNPCLCLKLVCKLIVKHYIVCERHGSTE